MKMLPKEISHSTEITLMAVAVLAVCVSIYSAWFYYVKKENLPLADGAEINPVQKTIYHKYYADEFYEALFTKPLNWLSEKLHKIIEIKAIDRTVDFVGESVTWMSSQARLIQTGHIGFYIFAMVISIILILFFKLI
jgi:NADH-quinone oxidoreductase subunit L